MSYEYYLKKDKLKKDLKFIILINEYIYITTLQRKLFQKIAGAVSLFVNDTINVSNFKKNIMFMDQQIRRDFLNNNYINLKTDKKFLQSSNKQYVRSFINHKNFKKTDINRNS